MSFRRAGVSLLLILITVCSLVSLAGAAEKSPARIVAVGDVHGDHDSFTQLLQRAQLVDQEGNWTGGNATLVQTGDLVDRGAKVRQTLDLVMALEERARKQDGRVVSLLGNHEAMQVMLDLRYVTPEIYASFAGADAEKRREKAWKQYVEWAKRRARRFKEPEPSVDEAARQAWMEAHPPGYFEYLEAFSARGTYGKWIRKRDTLQKIGGIVFVHGGIDPRLAARGLDDINRSVRDELARFDALREWLVREGIGLPFFTLQELSEAVKKELEKRKAAGVLPHLTKPLEEFVEHGAWLSINPDGPLWFRGYARWDDTTGAAHIDELLKAFGATHFVVGHSPLADGRIRSRFSGRVFLIDTGMLSSYYKNGRASALEISEGKFSPIYTDAPRGETATAPPPDAAAAVRPRLVSAAYPQSAPVAAAAQPAAAPAKPHRAWAGPDGQPLPFKNDEEILEFLKTAKVMEIKGIPEGITAPQKVLLEKDGIRAHAVFRAIDQEKLNYNTGVAIDMLFRDHYLFEPAAYHLSLLLGMDNVPPAIPRHVGGKSGSIQLWLEGAMNETARRKRRVNAPNQQYWAKQMQTMHLFDVLIYNMDRNSGNILMDKDWKIWFIDHTRAFRRYDDLKDAKKKVLHVERGLFERLKKLDAALVEERLKPYLRGAEIKAIMIRRDKLVRYLEGLIVKKGENKVLFDWDATEIEAAAARP